MRFRLRRPRRPGLRHGDRSWRHDPDRSRLWLPGLAAGGLAIAALLILPFGTQRWTFVYLCATLIALVVLLGAALAMPAGIRGVWWSLFAFQVLTMSAQAISDRDSAAAGGTIWLPGRADWIALIAYVPVLIALGVLIHRLTRGRDREAWIDSSILTVAAASVFALFLIVPVVSDPALGPLGVTIAVIYLLLDLAVVSALIWLLVGGGRPPTPLLLVAVSFALTLAADILRDLSLIGVETSESTALLDALRVASLIVLTAAATAPGAAQIAEPRDNLPPRATTPRLAVLAVGALVVPSLVAIRLWTAGNQITLLLSLAAIIVIILAVWRIKILVTTVDQQRQVTELVLDSTGDGIIGLDRQGFVLFANLSARRMLRCRETDLIGRRFHDIAHHEYPDGRMYPWPECPVHRLVGTGREALISDQVYLRRDGTTFPVEIVMSPLRVDGVVTGAVQSFRDVSERHAVEQMKRQFVSVVSHELRTPLTSIKGSLQMLESGIVGDLSTDQGELVAMAVKNSDRLSQLVNDILDLERLDSGRLPLEPEVIGLTDLAEQAVSSMSGAAGAAGVTLSLVPDRSAAGVAVWADPHRMTQVLANLLGNAIKFSERGAPIAVHVSASGDLGVIAVVDTGRGIPAEQLESVFERFGQVDVGDARRDGGTGLGLAIAREITERSGGQIAVTSAVGEGTTFTVTLPLHRGPAEDPTEDPTAADGPLDVMAEP